MFLDIEYQIIVSKQRERAVSAKLCDGSKTLVRADFTFTEGQPVEIARGNLREVARTTPADPNVVELTEGAVVKGEYQPNQAALTALLTRFGIDEQRFDRIQLSGLLWSSYLIGMEQPGRRALFHKLAFEFANPEHCQGADFYYEARVISRHALGMLQSELRLSSGDRLVGKGESWAFLLPKSPVGSVCTIASLLPPSDILKGKVGLVVGASRGLGAMLTAALALQGCTVLANYNRSEPEAQQLTENLANAPGSVTPVKGDAANLASCQELKARVLKEFGRLDFLICNACPSLLPLQLEPSMVGRINSYVNDALPLVSVPLSVFMDLLAENCGWSVLLSSTSVETTPKEWPHYVALKYAIEGLARVAALQYPNASFLLVRPPKLQTDLTNSPIARGSAMPTEEAAVKILQRLLRAATEHVEVLSLQ